MKRNIVVAVLVAVLLCPLIADSGSCETDSGIIIGYVSDGIVISVLDENDDLTKYSTHSVFHLEAGYTIFATKIIGEVGNILLNGELYGEGLPITVEDGVSRYIFHLDRTCVIGICSNDIVRNSECFSDWEQYDDINIKRFDCATSGVYNLPTTIECVGWDKEFISWRDSTNNVCNSIDCSSPCYHEVVPNLGLHSFNIIFYDEVGSVSTPLSLTSEHFEVPEFHGNNPQGWFYMDNVGNECEFNNSVILEDNMLVYAKYYETPKEPEAPTYNVRFFDKGSLLAEKKLSDEYFEVPYIDSENFLGWYYYDDQNNECKFEKGVPLKDGMEVHSNYSEVAVSQEDDIDNSGSKDTSLYSMLTENGIKITDNEILESIIASSIFVVLALSTFLFFFRRH